MFNESSLAASSTSTEDATTVSIYDLPAELLEFVMNILPVHDQINFKIALGRRGVNIDTTVTELKKLFNQPQLTEETVETVRAILTRQLQSMHSHPEFPSILGIDKLIELKESMSDIKFKNYQLMSFYTNPKHLLGAIILIAGVAWFTISKIYMLKKTDAIHYLLTKCKLYIDDDYFIDGDIKLNEFAPENCVDAMNKLDAVPDEWVLISGLLIGGMGSILGFVLLLLSTCNLNNEASNNKYPVKFLEDFEFIYNDWQKTLKEYQDLFPVNDIGTIAEAINALDSIKEKAAEINSLTIPAAENKTQLEQQITTVCQYSSFFSRRQGNRYELDIVIRDEIEDDVPLLLHN